MSPSPPRFTLDLWAGIEDVWAGIRAHPFLEGLADGSLPRAAFRFYAIQDAHYLADYARALAVCAARAPSEDAVAMFAAHAEEAIAVERELHDSFFTDLDVSAEELRATPQAPTCRAYTSYLLASAYGGSPAEGIAAVLPCYWIYREAGRELAARGESPDPLYARWVAAYASEEFDATVERVLHLTDEVAATAGAAERGRMAERFHTTSRYEWMFWDMGWREERWPTIPGPYPLSR